MCGAPSRFSCCINQASATPPIPSAFRSRNARRESAEFVNRLSVLKLVDIEELVGAQKDLAKTGQGGEARIGGRRIRRGGNLRELRLARREEIDRLFELGFAGGPQKSQLPRAADLGRGIGSRF